MKHFRRDVHFADDEFKLCRKCDTGWIDLNPQQCGWRRMPKNDTREAYCWLTAGGALYYHPKWEKPLTIAVLCNCVRRAMHIPPTSDSAPPVATEEPTQ